MNRSIRRIDLNDLTVLASPNYTDLLPFVSEWSIARALKELGGSAYRLMP
jgi:hypothetical protein